MKTITLIALIIGVLAIGTVVAVEITGNIVQEETTTQSCGADVETCPYKESGSCGGGCTRESACGSATCGAIKTSTCGCQN